MITVRKRVAAALLTGALLIAASGCSSVTTSGTQIADPAGLLNATLERLKQDNKAGIDQGSSTIGDGTRCFYQLPTADADDVTDEVACGPIRRLGKSDQQVWDTYRLSYLYSADGQLTGAVDQVREKAVGVDPALLVSATGDEPVPVDQVPAPKAPPTTVTNRAMMLASSAAAVNTLGEFTKLKEPIRLLTPAVDLEVTAMAQSKLLPPELFSAEGEDGEDDEDVAPAYSPAAGQVAYAFAVSSKAGTGANEPLSSSAASRIKVLATSLAVTAGEESIPIIDESYIPNVAGAKTMRVPCQAADGGKFPCTSDHTADAVLLMTVPEGTQPALAASAVDAEQSVDLTSGELTSSVSRVEYDRDERTQKIGKTLEAGPLKAKSKAGAKDKAKDKKRKKAKKKSEIQSSWRMEVDTAGLTAFDPYRGWAGEGRAWLLVSTHYRQAGEGYKAWDTSRLDSVRLSVGGKKIDPHGLSDDYFDGGAGSEVTWAFPVDADTTKATFEFQPTGTYTGGKKDKDFTTKSAATYELEFAK